MSNKYNHTLIEKKWADRWFAEGTYSVDLQKAEKPFYNLMMFPYPSAAGLHVGNVFAFIGSDIQGRFMRARGYDVFEPMGFDAFGIHSENYAIKVDSHPVRLVSQAVEHFKENQLKRIGAMFDWSHSVNTTDPVYYRWTQWIFVQLFKAGLAYRQEAPVNWCPSCKTVLSDEQVEKGLCERCDSEVRLRNMRQWFFRITAYAQRLLDNLDWIDWSQRTKTIQRNWIGRSEGAEIKFLVSGTDKYVSVYTTRPDTLWGASYIVLSPEHPMVNKITVEKNKKAVEDYISTAGTKSSIERQGRKNKKSGVFTGAYAENPVNGNPIPVWISDYVLMSYGTGAIMAVPAHDNRDFEFASVFQLPIIQVISPDGKENILSQAYTGSGILINSGQFSGMDNIQTGPKIVDWLAKKNKANHTIIYSLHDWCISRQRYWGPPIPIIHCKTCGAVPVPEKDLPVILPMIEDFKPDGSGKSPLTKDPEFIKTPCPQCGQPATRETDVCDNFLDSAWYFFRYPSVGRTDVPFDPELTEKWLPVDMYIGGNEHAVLHLMYTRFITMALKDLGFINFEEPFRKFRAHGLLKKNGVKMNKSKGNVVIPEKYINQYGTDTFRMYLMFLGPYSQGGDFQDKGINGIRRFIERIWRYITENEFSDKDVSDSDVINQIHKTIKKVTEDISELRYNTAIAAMMELFNILSVQDLHSRGNAKIFLQMLCPFAPFISHELWEQLGEEMMVGDIHWPEYDPALISTEKSEFVIQINSKNKIKITMDSNGTEKDVMEAACENGKIKDEIGKRNIVKTFFVPNKLLNIVVKR